MIDEFKFKKAETNIRYKPLDAFNTKTGQPFFILRSDILPDSPVLTQEELNKLITSQDYENQIANDDSVPF